MAGQIPRQMMQHTAAITSRFCTNFTTWFILPEQGMKDLEILNRGSAFLVSARSKSFHHKYHLITASHVAAPYKWRNLYGDEFLNFISSKSTHHTTEIRHADGFLMAQLECETTSYHHPSRDLAVLHIKDEAEVVPVILKLGLQTLNLVDRPGKGTGLTFHGHEVMADDPFDNSKDEDKRKPFPRSIPGTLMTWTKHQIFSKTEPVLSDGMCGGPVCISDSRDCVGLIEGIIPEQHEVIQARGMAAHIEADVISNFIDMIESGEADDEQYRIVGGEAAFAVGSDQDESKMGVENLMRRV